jgi:hypothetical protein
MGSFSNNDIKGRKKKDISITRKGSENYLDSRGMKHVCNLEYQLTEGGTSSFIQVP